MTSKLSRTATIAILATAVMMLGVFVFPLWVIHLEAPQYPQGLGIHIWVDRIDGAAPHDLQNINGLNHYIGMKAIEPGEIPELRYMKYFAMGLAALAALVAAIRRKWALVAWVVLAVAVAGVGMYDFYKWEYDYGHDLNPDAAIKVPGMSYQPPMFGTRQMLNFRTTAWPGAGGILAMIGVALGVFAMAWELFLRGRLQRGRPGAPERARSPRAATALSLSVILVIASGCTRKPPTINYGTDSCAYCSMTIENDRYGAAFTTSKGRVHVFDSVECMIESQQAGEKFADTRAGAYYVVDYATHALIDATTAAYLVSESLPSPMGANLTSFLKRGDAEHVQHVRSGEILDWTAVNDYVARRAWEKDL